jgi:release factor glutamine methyltransferase
MTEDESILTHILQCRTIDLAINKPVLTVPQQKQFESYKQRREAGEPLQYILGTCSFMGLELTVNPAVLVPRPETEQLVDSALKHLTLSFPNVLVGNPVRILDLGTGSGNIAIALAKFVLQSNSVGIDRSAKALDVAKANARKHGVEDRIQFIQDDFMVSLQKMQSNSFDLIISNPPYIPTNQLSGLPQDVQEEPIRALDGGADGLDFYRIIIKYTPHLLRSGACLMMEFGDGQAEAINKLIEAQKDFSKIEIIQDLAGRDRIIKAIK